MMNNEFENNPNPQNDIPQPTFTPAPDFERAPLVPKRLPHRPSR